MPLVFTDASQGHTAWWSYQTLSCMPAAPFFFMYCLDTDMFARRFARVENGECIIGMQRPAMIPLIVFDLLVNVSRGTGLGHVTC